MANNLNESDLMIFRLTESAIDILRENRNLCSRAAGLIVNGLYEFFFDNRVEILGINHRIKSENSTREKIIRRKLYKAGATPEEIFNAIPDIIGVMVECEFLENEKPLFELIKKHFNVVNTDGWHYSDGLGNLFVDFNAPQPITQKNGNQLYKLDCYYILEGFRINFELQIKSLVNSFWSEVEHNIVYKNNHFIPDDDYINEMLAAVRMNLLGLDKILHLISGRINALNSFSLMKDIELSEELITQLVSDLINNKMMDSLGFTVDVKAIRELLVLVLTRRSVYYTNHDAFYKYLERFRILMEKDLDFTKAVSFGREYTAGDRFKQMLGDKLISVMNSDFEWYSFFMTLFYIDGSDPLTCLDGFLSELRDAYVGAGLFDSLTARIPAGDVETVVNETRVFTAEALCQLAGLGIRRLREYEKGLIAFKGYLPRAMDGITGLEGWNLKKREIRSDIIDILCAYS